MTTQNLEQLKTELNSFFLLIVLNLVFGALAMAFGIQFIIASVSGLTAGQATTDLRVLAGAIALVCFGLGLAWIRCSATILKGIKGIRREIRYRAEPVPDVTLTCWIVRMTAHYRENRQTIRTMVLVCTAGGLCFLTLGIISSLEFISISLSSVTFTLNSYLLIPSAVLAMCVAAVSLASSFYFARFSRTWDLRQEEISGWECELAETLGRD